VPIEWGASLGLRFTHQQTSPGGDNQAPRYATSIDVRWGASADWQSIQSWRDEPVANPVVSASLVPGGGFVAIDSDRPYADEGEHGHVIDAWRCDASRHSCARE
jgi:hypothetical protein